MDVFVTSVVTAIVTAGGTWVTYLNRNNDSVDKRLDLALKANHQLIEDYRIENDKLLRRVTDLETSRDVMDAQLRGVRDTLNSQGMELATVRHQNSDWQRWSAEVLAWCAMAMGIITGLGATVPPPPTAPSVFSPDV